MYSSDICFRISVMFYVEAHILILEHRQNEEFTII